MPLIFSQDLRMTSSISVDDIILANIVAEEGGTTTETTKFEHIYVAVITFFPFFCADTFIISLLLIVCSLR